VDFAFSFDSLVHVEADALGDYIDGLAVKLSDTGTAFIHHSNLGEYRAQFERFGRIPPRLRSLLADRELIDRSHLRASTVTAAWFSRRCSEAGLRCIGQEVINWGTRRLIDCLSVLTRPDAPLARPNEVVRNPFFMAEAMSICAWRRVHLRNHPAAPGRRD
jgi:hypothetical protein